VADRRRPTVPTSAAVLLALALATLAGCGAAPSPQDPLVVRACAGADELSKDSCPRIVTTALDRLGSMHAPIEDVRRADARCLPTERCAARGVNDLGVVVVWFSLGEPAMVRVTSERQPDGVGFHLVAGDPEAIPVELRGWIERHR
jgi:hypothetical protein